MKTRTKALLLAMCAVLLVVTTVMATLAFLTSQTEVVKNTFTVGNVKITLDEAKVDEYGVEVAGADRVLTNEYKLMPGHTYVKDPTVHVAADSEDCWLFVKITDEIAAIQDATTIAAQLTANGWTPVANETNVYAYRKKVSGGANVPVFESFKVVGNITNEALAAYAGKTITVQAYAIQADGFANADAAWVAFVQQTSNN